MLWGMIKAIQISRAAKYSEQCMNDLGAFGKTWRRGRVGYGARLRLSSAFDS